MFLVLLCTVPYVTSATIYQPGETLEPDCAPGALNCGVAVTTSLLGTSTQIANSMLSIQATSTGSILASFRAFLGQIANLFQVQDSGGANLFSIDAVGAARFSNTLSVGNLDGPLQAHAGLVSATSSVGVLYGGTGLSSSPSFGNVLVGNSSGGYTLTSTSSLGFSTYTSENVANRSTSTNLGTSDTLYPTQNAVKTYVDDNVIGLHWRNPLQAVNVIANSATPVGATVEGDAYIIDTGGNTGAWSAFLPGDLVQYQTGAWAKLKSLAIGDRFGVALVSTSTPFGTFTGFNNYTFDVASGVPGAYTYTSTAPSNGDARYISNASSTYSGVSFTYSLALTQWVQLSSRVNLSYGSGLRNTSNVLSLSDLTADWNQSGAFNIITAGNVNANTFTGNGSGLTSLNANNLTNFGAPFYAFFSATTTDALAQGATNKYYSDAFVQSFLHASSTIPKTYTANIFTAANTFSGGLILDTLNGPLQANAGLVSATSSIGIFYGGTGATSFGQGWLFSSGGGDPLAASTSPTINYVVATSTTATSTFAGGVTANLLSVTSTTATSTFANGIDITGGCFSKNGSCIGLASDLQHVTSYKLNDTYTNIVAATTTLTTISITPNTPTGDIIVRAGVTFTSGSAVDQPVSIAIRQTSCTGAALQSILYTVASAINVESPNVELTYIAVDPGTTPQTYAFCMSTSAGDTNVSAWNMSAVVVDTGADVAEVYTTNDATLEAGDVVSYDASLATGVKKSATANDQNVLGIVSTRPGVVIGGVSREGVKAVPVALSGRVPVKVVTENGDINPGDYLAPSSLPGVAMKSKGLGSVIGQALSSYSGADVGIVLVFVKNFDLSPIKAVAVLMGDISPQVNADGSDNGLSTLIATIQSEVARDPVAVIAQKIADGEQFLTNFVTARVTAIRGYFDEIFAKKIHTEKICVKKSDGEEACIDGDQLEALLGGDSGAPIVDPVGDNPPTVGSTESPPPSLSPATTDEVTPLSLPGDVPASSDGVSTTIQVTDQALPATDAPTDTAVLNNTTNE